MKTAVIVLAAVLAIAVIGTTVFLSCTPAGRAVWNGYRHTLRQTDDATLYETRRHVEDTCRSMIASYESDRLTWIQYKDSFNTTQRSWADQAKMRANKTASTYNNYILKNSYVWEGNVPADIRQSLEYLE